MGMPGRRTINLEFEGGMAGTEIKLKAASVNTMLALRSISIQDAVPLLAEHLISWNIENDDNEIVAFDEKQICDEVEPQMIRIIISEWYKVAVGISAPLDPPSNDGPVSQDTVIAEPSIPMEAL